MLGDAASVRGIVATVPAGGDGYEVVVVDARLGPATSSATEPGVPSGQEQPLLLIPQQPAEAEPDAPTPAATPQTLPEIAMAVEPLLTPVGVDQLFANPALLPKLDQPLPDVARMLGADTPSDTSEAEPQDGASQATNTPLAGAFNGASLPGPAPAATVTPPGEAAATAGPPAAAAVPQGQAMREAVAGDEQVAETLPADSAGEETAALPAAGPQTAAPLALGFAGMSASSSDSPAVIPAASAEPQTNSTTMIVPPAGAASSTPALSGAATVGQTTTGTTTGTNPAALAGTQQQVSGQTTTTDTSPSSAPTSADTQNLLANLPIRFEANQGQFNAQTQFVAHAPSYDLYLGSTQSAFVLPGPVTQDANGDPVPGGPGAVVNVQLVGANASAQATGVNQLVTRTNYLIGNDQSQWVTNVPNYAGVQFSNVYNGVNLSYYESQGNLEHDFIVSPGANPNQIVSQFSGAQQLSLDVQGNLVIQTAKGSLTEQRPVAYQVINGTQVAVASSFVLNGDQVSFALGHYDTSHQLVIDPSWVYSSHLGGSGYEVSKGIALDSSGAAYIVGSTNNPGGIPGSGATPTWIPAIGFPPGNSVFVAKVAPDGKTLQYLTFLGSTTTGHNDGGDAIVVDTNYNAYITGATNTDTFPTAGAWQPHLSGVYNAFVTKLNKDGTLGFSTYLGGAGSNYGNSIALDSSNNTVWVAGQVTGGTNAFRTAPNPAGQAMPLVPIGSGGGGWDTFVAQLTANNLTPTYLAAIGGAGNDYATGIAVGTNDNAYITGYTASQGLGPPVTAFPTTAGAIQRDLLGSWDAFVAEITPKGAGLADLVYSTYFGGAGSDYAYGIALDQANDAYIVGKTLSGATPFGSAKTITPTVIGKSLGAGGSDAFVARFDPNGDPTTAPYFVLVAGTNPDYGIGIALQPGTLNPKVFITGQTFSDQIPRFGGFPTPFALQSSYGGNGDAFVAMLDPTQPANKSLVYNTYVGGSGTDIGYGIAADANGNTFATGATGSGNLRPPAPPPPGLPVPGFQTTFGGGNSDGFVVKISPNPAGVPGPKLGAFNTNFNDFAGTLLTFQATAQTFDGNPAGFDLDGAPTGASINFSTGVFNWTPTSAQVGTWTFGIQAVDAEGRFDEQYVTVTVNQTASSTTLTSSASSALPGQAVTFTATVTGAGGTPTGNVTFLDGTTVLGSGTLAVVNGQDVATYTTSTLTTGTHAITASYAGDGTFGGSSASLSQPVSLGTTSIGLSSSLNPSQPNQAVTFTVTLTATGGTPTGMVTFLDGTTTLGTGTLALLYGQDVASLTTSSLASGPHAITAVYTGDSSFADSSNTISQNVGSVTASGTTTTVSASANPALPGQAVTLTATVNSMGGSPGGTVTFLDGTTVLGSSTLALVNGQEQATWTTSALASGPHAITAVYGGGSNFAPSASWLNEVVQPGGTTTSLSSSGNPSQGGQAVTLTATVSAMSGTPTGTVAFLDGTTVLGTGTLAVVNSQDVATFTTSALAAGSHAITASYAGDGTFAPGASGDVNQLVDLTSTTTDVSSDDNPATAGDTITFTATVTSALGSVPTGTVNFYDGSTLLDTETLDNTGQATFATSSLAQVDHYITVVYAGNSLMVGSTSGVLDQTVL